MSACDRNELLLLAAGELDPTARSRAEAHVADCPDCAAELAELRAALDLPARLPAIEPSAAAVERTRHAAQKALARRRQALRPSFAVRYRYVLAAAAMLAAVIGWAMIEQMLSPQQGPNSKVAGTQNTSTLVDDWNTWQNAVTDSTVLADDLMTLQADDAWARAEVRVAGAAQSTVNDDLQEILDYLELIEDDQMGGS